VEGNLHAEARVNFTKKLLDEIGIGGERLEMFFISSAMAPQFIEVAKEMTDRITKLGPALPKKVTLTKRSTENKREFLYDLLRNLALKVPEKPLPVPEGLEEFGTVAWNLSKCIGCKKCEEICPEDAIEFVRKFDLPSIIQTVSSVEEASVKPTKRRLLYETIAKVAITKPSQPIPVPEGLEEFSEMRPLIEKCVVCEKCGETCPEEAIEIVREIDLPTIIRRPQFNLPEV
jgi:ferredoxin